MAKKSKFNWERLLGPSSVGSAGEGSDAGDGSARAAAGAGAAAAVVRVQSEQQLARLWAGYGSIKSLKVEVTPRGGGAAAVRHLVAKAVDPPRGLAGDAGHQRKLDSYAVEAEFYRSCAPRLAELARGLGLREPGAPPAAGATLDAAGAAAAGAGAGADAGAGGLSWCWCPEPVVVEAEPPQHFLFVLSDLRGAFPKQPHSYDEQEAMVALEWLASFHAAWWEEERPEGLWEDGCYWHLHTRQEELAQIGGSWGDLKRNAFVVDAALRGSFGDDGSGGDGSSGGGSGIIGAGGGAARRFTTLCHGDAKSANFMFSKDGKAAAAYDFQYVGSGYGAKDVAYLLISSVDESCLVDSEQQLLRHYYASLLRRLEALGKRDAAEAYSFELFEAHYDLAVIDYCRFMAGWGWWGAARYAGRRCKDALGRLKGVLGVAAAAARRW